MRESSIERHLINETERRGGEVRKVKWIGRAHAPDRLLLLSPHHYLVECKAPGKRPSAGQAREHARLRKAGFVVLVLDTIEAVDGFFRNR